MVPVNLVLSGGGIRGVASPYRVTGPLYAMIAATLLSEKVHASNVSIAGLPWVVVDKYPKCRSR
ncbi:MAG: hypothetical protein ACKOKF_01195, partial [Bacteroidota bacterium]